MIPTRAVVVTLLALATCARAAPPSPEAERAKDLLEDGDLDAARRAAEPLVTGEAPDALALQVLGRIARREGRTDDAVRLLEAAVAADPGSSEAHVHLTGAYVDQIRTVGITRKLGLARKVRDLSERAVDLDGESCDARRALAEFYLEAPKMIGGSPERARLEAEQYRKRCAAHAHLAFAVAAQTSGDLAAAEAECLEALRADPSLGEGFAMLGWIERLRGAGADAGPSDASRDLLAAAPEWHRALHAAGRAGALPGPNVEKAENALRSAIKHARTATAEARHRWALGVAHQIRGDMDAAWREHAAAIALEPGMELAVRGRDSLRPAALLVAASPAPPHDGEEVVGAPLRPMGPE